MKAKNLTLDDYLKRGFSRFWLQRTTRPEGPKPKDAVRLAAWLEVPMEYLFGGAPEYRRMRPWEVASHSSLDLFFKRHREGREASRIRRDLEDHLEVMVKQAPKTVAAWAAAFDAFQRGRRRGREESHILERAIGTQKGRREEESPPRI